MNNVIGQPEESNPNRTRVLRSDLSVTKRFLATLNGGPSKNAQFVFQTIDIDKSRKKSPLTRTRTGRLGELREQLERLNQAGAGVYVTVNRVRPGERRRNENVDSVR